MKDKYIKPLRLANKLFYWIPEMINHPQQKYIADPSMARSNTKKKNNMKKSVEIYFSTDFFIMLLLKLMP